MSRASNLLLALNEGGAVQVPVGLKKKIFPVIKTALIGYLNQNLEEMEAGFFSMLDNLEDSEDKFVAGNLLTLFKKISKKVKKQAASNPKLAKEILRKKAVKVDLAPEDFGKFEAGLKEPFDKGWKLPVKISTNVKTSPDARKGIFGSFGHKVQTVRATGEMTHLKDTIYLTTDVSKLAYYVNHLKSNLNWFNKSVDSNEPQEKLVDWFNQTITILDTLDRELDSITKKVLSNAEHEMTHLIQAMTGAGMEGEYWDRNKEIPTMVSKIFGRNIEYLTSDVEYKPWIKTVTDEFYIALESSFKGLNADVRSIAKDKRRELFKDSFKALVKHNAFVNAYRTLERVGSKIDDKLPRAKQIASSSGKSLKDVIKDLSIAIQKDRRYTPFKGSF
jgi:hypothetical protein